MQRSLAIHGVSFALLNLSLLSPTNLFGIDLVGDARDTLFSRYPGRILIETGTSDGHGVQRALAAGYQRVISIEIHPPYYYRAKSLFANDPRVLLVLGDSAICLKDVLKDIHEPVTFWLDGHHDGADTTPGIKICPLLDELAQIADHEIRTHTILIDDMRLLEGWWATSSKKEVIDIVRRINPLYDVRLEDGFMPGDVLVAQVPPT